MDSIGAESFLVVLSLVKSVKGLTGSVYCRSDDLRVLGQAYSRSRAEEGAELGGAA